MATATNAANSPRGQSMTSSVTPWNQISRAESEPDVVVAEEETLENGSGSTTKRPAWNKPSNGHEIGLGPVNVMGAHSWPALSDAARASSTKSSSLDSLKTLAPDTSSSLSASQGSGSSGNVPSSPQRQNSNPSSNPTHTAPSRQRSMKRNANSSFNGGTSHPPPPQGFATVDGPINGPSPRDQSQRSGFVPQQPHGDGGDHPPQRPFRNRNGGHPRGGDGGSHHHNNYGGVRRDAEWSHRNFNGRDTQLQSPRGVQRYMRPGGPPGPPPPPPPPPSSTPYVPPQVRPTFMGPMGFSEMPSMYFLSAPPPESLRGVVPFLAPIPVYVPAPDPQLYAKIVNQIDYYFSNENLIKDTYLRTNMDEQGWVPIRLIAGFKKVSLLTQNLHLILTALQNSTVVEVQGDKVRRRGDGKNWVLPPRLQLPNSAAQPPQGNASLDMTTGRLQNLALDHPNSAHYNNATWSQFDGRAESSLSRSSSGDISNNNQTGIPFQGTSNHLASARSSN